MIFRKGFLFALAALGVIVPQMAFAATDTGLELPLSSVYDYKQDPFLLQWTFQIEEEKPAIAVIAPLSQEDKILNRWKTKQAHLWTSLPTEPFTINASAYTAAADECGKSDGITASGLKVAEKRTLACPPQYPFGTKVSIAGMGEFRCEDRGGAIKGNHFDIYMETKKEAFAFGRRNLVAEVIE